MYTNFVMIGNPGVGKSTILNALVGEVKFEAGISLGCGLTTVCQKYKIEGTSMMYIDTPGLSDIDLRKKAAVEITSALKSGGYFRIFFVITLEAGRVRPDDITTMKLVLDSAPIKSNYSVIVNKLHPDLVQMLNEGENRQKLETAINRNLPGTTSIYYNIHIAALDSTKKNQIHDLPSALAKFILSSPLIAIPKESVQEIKDFNFDKMRKKLGKIIEQLQKDKEEMTKAIKENQERMIEIQNENEKKLKELQDNHNNDLKEMMAEHTRQLKKISDKKDKKVQIANPEPPQQAPSPAQAPSSAQTPQQAPSPSPSRPSNSVGTWVGGVAGVLSNVLVPGSGPFVAEIVKNWF